MKTVYLDYAAATPLDDQVLEAMRPYFSELFYNPSALYLPAKSVASAIRVAKQSIAHWLGALEGEIVLTAGATEANNLAISGLMSQFPGANVVVSQIEHESVLAPAGLFDLRLAPVNKAGLIDLARLSDLIDDQTVLVSVMYANNEIGTISPIRDVAALIKTKQAARLSKLPLFFHSDAAQAANFLDLHTASLGVDLMSINGGKIYGPKQSGCLYVNRRVNLKPLILGGGQENGLRSGTENVPAALGLAKALDLAQSTRKTEAERLTMLRDSFMDQISRHFKSSFINGSIKKRLPNNVHVTFPGVDNERLLMQLEAKGILAAAGSACSASMQEASHVLTAIGLDDKLARSSIRFSLGRQTTARDIDRTIKALQATIALDCRN